MKCKRCDGDGVIIYYDYQYADKEVCPDCDGNGVVEPMTEQEYFQTCNTEQLADVLAKQKCDGCNDEPYDEEHSTCKYCMMQKKEQIMEWLKQPHTVKE